MSGRAPGRYTEAVPGNSNDSDDADELDLRTARSSDAGAIARVHLRALRGAYVGILPHAALEALEERALTARWKATIRSELVLVASLGREVLGVVASGREAHGDPFFRGEISAIYVAPGHHRRGIGTGLMFEALQHVELPALLWVPEENHGARAFFEAFGALPVRRRTELLEGTPLSQLGYAFFDPN